MDQQPVLTIPQNQLQNQMQFMPPDHTVNGTWIIIFGLATLAGLGIWLYLLKRKYPSLNLGEILSSVFSREHETVFVLTLLLINVTEAIMAASIHPSGQTPPNPLARFLSHMGIQLIAIAAGTSMWRELAKAFEPKISKAARTARFLKGAAITYAAIKIPFINLDIIANGLHEDVVLSLYQAGLNPFIGHSTLVQAYQYYGYPENYSPWGGMSYVMCTSTALTHIHMMLIGIEGLSLLDPTSETRQKLLKNLPLKEEKKEEKKDEKKEDKDKKKDKVEKEDLMNAEKRNLEKVPDNLAFLLKRVGYSGDQLDKFVKQASEKLDKMPPQEGSKMSERLSNLVNECNTLTKSNLSGDEKKKKNNEIKDKIHKIFAASPNATEIKDRGFGMTLKKGN